MKMQTLQAYSQLTESAPPMNLWLKSFKKERLREMIMDEKGKWEPYISAQTIDQTLREEKVNYSIIWRALCFTKTISWFEKISVS